MELTKKMTEETEFTSKSETCKIIVNKENVYGKRIDNGIEIDIPLPIIGGGIYVDGEGEHRIYEAKLKIAAIMTELCSQGSLVVISNEGQYYIVEYEGYVKLDVPRYYMFIADKVIKDKRGNYVVQGKNVNTGKVEKYALSRTNLLTKLSHMK